MMFWERTSERPTLTNRAIILEFIEFNQKSTNVTDSRTDGQTTCDRKNALCTVVHRAVKMVKMTWNLRVIDKGTSRYDYDFVT